MITPEFSHPVSVDGINRNWSEYKLAASPEERVALAERFELISLDKLEGTIRLRRGRDGETIDMLASIDADVVQPCIVSLAPVPSKVAEDFELTFLSYPVGQEPDDHDLEAPEPIEGGKIDLGEVLAQQLALALDPFPRAQDAEIPESYRGDPNAVDSLPSEEDRPNPFAALEALKKR
ncbi:YceD family protein [Lacibacterium aquatile]|uniref:YceD family protein n=1 Tax=Lacibacterium aquatile TaxID=1168082 RepID=A0ABW5DMS2_9PROT